MPTPDSLFDDSYFVGRHGDDPKRNKSFAVEQNWMKSLGVDFTGRVLDFGCSTGEFLEAIDWRGERFGIEVNQSAASEARAKGITVVDSANDIDKVDTVVCRGVIQHLENPFGFLEDMHRVLAVGGRLIFLATPNSESPAYRLFLDLPALDRPRNYWIPGRRELELYCKRAGFTFESAAFPYFRSGYASPLDFPKFFARLIIWNRKLTPKAFPRNMMNLSFIKY